MINLVRLLKRQINLFLVLFFLVQSGIALAESYEYPELMMAPKYSERLLLEAQKERKDNFLFYIPIQVSSLMTLTAGLLQFSNVNEGKDPQKGSPWVGVTIGGVWLSATLLLGSQYQAYSRSYLQIKSIEAKTKRDMLVRERMAEEQINRIGSLGRKMAWASTASNMFASIYMMSKSGSKDLSKVANTLSLIASIAPLVLPNPWADVAEEQEGYKKKIYGDLAFSPMAFDAQKNTIVPGLTASLSF